MIHHARKRFGQNFLQDAGIIYSIVALINPSTDAHVIEIGPGLGALTKPLLRNLDHLDLLEIDRDLAASTLGDCYEGPALEPPEHKSLSEQRLYRYRLLLQANVASQYPANSSYLYGEN